MSDPSGTMEDPSLAALRARQARMLELDRQIDTEYLTDTLTDRLGAATPSSGANAEGAPPYHDPTAFTEAPMPPTPNPLSSSVRSSGELSDAVREVARRSKERRQAEAAAAAVDGGAQEHHHQTMPPTATQTPATTATEPPTSTREPSQGLMDEEPTTGGWLDQQDGSPTTETGEGEAEPPPSSSSTPNMDRESAQRYHRARVQVLQEQIAHYTAENRDLAAALGEAEANVKKEGEERKKHMRHAQALTEKLEKEAQARERAETEAQRLRDEVVMLRKEAESNARSAKSAGSETRNLDIRLNRANEETQKAKDKLAAERASKVEELNTMRGHAKKLEAKAQRLERQKGELLTAFRKQLKLIDVLKRQKIHIEAARALAFTEEEFMKTLDWGSGSS